MTDVTSTKFADLLAAYRRDGWAISKSFLSSDAVMALRHEAETYYKKCPRRRPGASTGQGQLALRLRHGMSAAEHFLSGPLTELKRCFKSDGEDIGDFVGQYAITEPGWFLPPHCDAYAPQHGFRYESMRVTLTIYLNEDWADSDGGHLRILGTGARKFEPVDILPALNTAVCLNSQHILHEVLPPKKLRFSLTLGSMRGLEHVHGGPEILTI